MQFRPVTTRVADFRRACGHTTKDFVVAEPFSADDYLEELLAGIDLGAAFDLTDGDLDDLRPAAFRRPREVDILAEHEGGQPSTRFPPGIDCIAHCDDDFTSVADWMEYGFAPKVSEYAVVRRSSPLNRAPVMTAAYCNDPDDNTVFAVRCNVIEPEIARLLGLVQNVRPSQRAMLSNKLPGRASDQRSLLAALDFFYNAQDDTVEARFVCGPAVAATEGAIYCDDCFEHFVKHCPHPRLKPMSQRVSTANPEQVCVELFHDIVRLHYVTTNKVSGVSPFGQWTVCKVRVIHRVYHP